MSEIPSGMGMMLKAMGVNPVEIMQSIDSFKTLAANMQAVQQGVDAKLDLLVEIMERVDVNSSIINEKCDTIIRLCSDHDDDPRVPREWLEGRNKSEVVNG
jgi:hypothetical protein